MARKTCDFQKKNCPCGIEFKPTSGTQIYCIECRRGKVKEYRGKYRSKNPQNTSERRGYNRIWYAKNSESVKARTLVSNQNRRKNIREMLNEVKSVPCMDCGIKYQSYVMDFDHVRGEKKFNLSVASNGVAIEKILEELKKCDIVCSNCHRERTHSRPSRRSTIGRAADL